MPSVRWLPSGRPLLPEVYARRHRFLQLLLFAHIPALVGLGVSRGQSWQFSAVLASPAVVALAGAALLRSRRVEAVLVTLGLSWCSFAVLDLSGGDAAAHTHAIAVLAFVALYQDWVPFGACVLAVAGLYGVPTAVDPGLIFRGDAQHRPLAWSAVHLGFFAAAGSALVLFWRSTETEQARVTELAADLGRQELAQERSALASRQASYALMTNLARRSQSLIGRQLATLDVLERDERDPDALAGLFSLDHLATRMRRNSENLLVLAGATAARSHQQPVPIGELLRGAVAEVEQYSRVDIRLGASGTVLGGAISDLAHLLAELLDNALACSPPTSRVVIGVAAADDQTLRLTVEDSGIGIAPAKLAEHNARLAAGLGAHAELEENVGATLGFPVVRRLAARHGLRVTLRDPDGGRGLVAEVALPPAVLLEATLAPEPGAVRPVAAVPARGGAPETPLVLPGRRAAPELRPGLMRPEEPAESERVEPAAAQTPETAEPGIVAGAWFEPAPLSEPSPLAPELGYALPTLEPLPGRGPQTVLHAAGAAVPAELVAGAPAPPTGGLTRRVPMQSMAAPLAAAPSRLPPGIPAPAVGGLLSAYQAGLTRGRGGDTEPRSLSTHPDTEPHRETEPGAEENA